MLVHCMCVYQSAFDASVKTVCIRSKGLLISFYLRAKKIKIVPINIKSQNEMNIDEKLKNIKIRGAHLINMLFSHRQTELCRI